MKAQRFNSKLVPLVAAAFLLTALLLTAGGAAAAPAHGDVVVPRDTDIFARITDDITSKKRDTNRGDVIVAEVQSDVVIDGEVVVERGAELYLRVERARKAKMFGRQGRLELAALSVRAVDGSLLPLAGAYDSKGRGRKVLTGVLTVAVAWPFAFLKGKNARVPEGTVIATQIGEDVRVRVPDRVAVY